MDTNVNYPELISQAQLGDKQSMDRLAELAGARLRAYIYRLTLNYDLAQDLSQDTILEMLKFLNRLKGPDSFWP